MLRGFIEKLGYNLYRVAIDIARILGVAKIRDTRYDVRAKDKDKNSKRGKEAHGTRVFNGDGVANNGNGVVGGVSRAGGSVEVYFDNVRGYVLGGRYVGGDRGYTLGWWEVGSLYERITYSEVGRRVFGSDPYGDVLDGVVVIYTNIVDIRRFGKPCVRVEYRPPRGYVKRNGLVSTVRLSFYELLKVWKALTKAILHVASQNVDYLKMFVDVFRSVSGVRVLCMASLSPQL